MRRQSIKCLSLFFLFLGVYAVKSHAQNKADWFYKSRYGVFVHYLYGLQNHDMPWNQGKTTDWDQCVNDFDVQLFSAQMQEAGAAYVVFTVHQIDKYFCIPNDTYEKKTGYKRGSATSNRDLIGELYAALARRNIKLLLYITGDGPKSDHKASKGVDNPSLLQAKGQPFKVHQGFITNWAAVIKDISLRYKTKVSGWWVDGCYDFIGYNDAFLGQLAKVMKAGNPNSLVAFNSGIHPKVKYYSKWDDYLAGEMEYFSDVPASQFLNGKQWHTLSYLGKYWARPGLRYKNEDMINYIKACNSAGGVVTMDACLLRNGSIDPEQLAQLKAIKKSIRG